MIVLVVEDDEFNLEVAQELLSQVGVNQVHIARNGLQGIRKFKSLDRVDAVLLDLYMPDMDGIEFISNLVNLNYLGKVILVSGVNLEMLQLTSQIAREKGLNVVASIVKPLQIESLSRALEAAAV